MRPHSFVLPLLSALFTIATSAHAHGPSGVHESPQWCGDTLAMLTDAGLLVHRAGTTRVIALPETTGLHAFSTDCSKIAVAHQQLTIVTLGRSPSVRSLGAVGPNGARAHRMDGPLPSIRWSPSGRTIALVSVRRTLLEAQVRRFDLATGRDQPFALPAGAVSAFALLDDDTAAVAHTPDASDREQRLFRATTASATRIDNNLYRYARFSMTNASAVVMGAADELFAIDLRNGTRTLLSAHIGYARGISPDGSRAIAAIDVMRSFSVATSGQGATAPIAAVGSLSSDESLSLSADASAVASCGGRTLLFEQRAASRTLVDARTSRVLRGHSITHAAIAPDGRRVAFVSERSRNRTGSSVEYVSELWTVDTVTSALTRIGPVGVLSSRIFDS